MGSLLNIFFFFFLYLLNTVLLSTIIWLYRVFLFMYVVFYHVNKKVKSRERKVWQTIKIT